MPVVQYIGSDPTWGPQQQVARRHLLEQTSVTLGLTDADPTIRGVLTGGNPYQRFRTRDSAYASVGAMHQWLRKRSDITTLGLPDQDVSIRRLNSYANPYQLRTIPTWTRTKAIFADQSSQAIPDADPTIHPPWQPVALRRPDSSINTIQAMLAWDLRRLNANDLLIDFDTTLKRVPQVPYQLYNRSYWARPRPTFWDWGNEDADPTLFRQPRIYSTPYQLYTTPVWNRLRPFQVDQSDQPVIPDDADPTLTRILYSYSRPYQLYDRTYWSRTKLIQIDQSDQGVVVELPPPDTTPSPPGGTSLGRRGPWYPDRTPEQVLQEEEEIMVLL